MPFHTSSPYITVRHSRIHGRGVFARKDIPQGARIIEYTGEKITKAQADKRNEPLGAVYIFELNKRYDIDGNVTWNTARYINHSCDPNAESEIIRGRIWIIALRNIGKGEEITYNYGYGYEEYEDYPCLCGTKRCISYILAEEHWPKLKRKRPQGVTSPQHRSRI